MRARARARLSERVLPCVCIARRCAAVLCSKCNNLVEYMLAEARAAQFSVLVLLVAAAPSFRGKESHHSLGACGKKAGADQASQGLVANQ